MPDRSLPPGILAQWCADAYVLKPDLRDDLDVAVAQIREVDGVIVIAFRGTVPSLIEDDLADLDMRPLGVAGVGYVHTGFWHAMERIAPLCQDLARKGPLVIAGHSLGGAIALNLAVHLSLLQMPPVQVTCFAPPRTGLGDSAYQAGGRYLSNTQIDLYRFGADPVPHLPPNLGGLPEWNHFGFTSVQIGDDRGLANRDDHAIARYQAALS